MMKKHGEHRTGAGPLWVFMSAACCALPRFPTVHPGVLSSSPAAPPVSSSSAGTSAASVSPDPECLKSSNAPCLGLFPVLSRLTLCRCSPPPPRSSPRALPCQKQSETILPLSTSLSESLFPAFPLLCLLTPYLQVCCSLPQWRAQGRNPSLLEHPMPACEQTGSQLAGISFEHALCGLSAPSLCEKDFKKKKVQICGANWTGLSSKYCS